MAALIVQPNDCDPICDDPIRVLPSDGNWDVVRFSGLALVPAFMLVSLVELWRHRQRLGPGGRRQMAPMLIAAPLWCVSTFAGYFADAFLDAAETVGIDLGSSE